MPVCVDVLCQSRFLYMALFRAVPTVARCPSRWLFSSKLPISPRSSFTRTGRCTAAKHVRHFAQKSKFEEHLEEIDVRKKSRSPWLLFHVAFWGFVALGVLDYDNKKRTSHGFMPCQLVAKVPVSTTASIFYLDPFPEGQKFWLWSATLALKADNADKMRKAWREGILWSVEVKQPQLQILRQYTPLPPSAVDDKEMRGFVKLLIRNEPGGEMSSYLHKLADKTDVDVRGPNHTFQPGDDVRQMVFFAGGTGIAPALQAAHALLGDHKVNRTVDPADLATRKLHILWANRTRSDCLGGHNDSAPGPLQPHQPKPQSPLQSKGTGFWTKLGFGSEPVHVPIEAAPVPVPAPSSTVVPDTIDTPKESNLIVRELEALKAKYPGQVTVDYYVDEENTWIDQNIVSKALARLNDREVSDVRDFLSPGQRQVLISGPPGFISYLAGPKIWADGMEQQGPLSGLIREALSNAHQDMTVWKI